MSHVLRFTSILTYLVNVPHALKQQTKNFHVFFNALFKAMNPWTLHNLFSWEGIANDTNKTPSTYIMGFDVRLSVVGLTTL
jgi:hypothetical protein